MALTESGCIGLSDENIRRSKENGHKGVDDKLGCWGCIGEKSRLLRGKGIADLTMSPQYFCLLLSSCRTQEALDINLDLLWCIQNWGYVC